MKLTVRDEAKPKFYKQDLATHTQEEGIEEELARLWTQRIISPMQSSSVAAPMVPVLKKNRKVQLCGDSKLTLTRPHLLKPTPCQELMSCMLTYLEEIFLKVGQKSLSVQLPTLWSLICSCNFSTMHGDAVE